VRIATIGLCDPGYAEDAAGAAHHQAVAELKQSVGEVFDAGLQTDERKSPPAVAELVGQHARQPFDAIVLDQVAWARPDVLLQVLRAMGNVPMVLHSPGSRVEDGVIHSTAPAAGAGSTQQVLRRHGVKFRYVWSAPGESVDPQEYMPFVRAARAGRMLAGAKLGMVGFGDMRLHITGFDVQEVHERFGVEVESLDMLELHGAMGKLSDSQIDQRASVLTAGWTYHPKQPAQQAWRKMIAMYMVLDDLAARRGYLGVSIKCPTGVAAVMGITPCLVGCLLARKYHYVCENDIPGLLGQTILGLLSEQMSTYWELYEVMEDSVLLGCCGFCPESFLAEPMRVRSFEGFLAGMGCCSAVRPGPYTVARLGKAPREGLVFHIAEGLASSPPSWCEEALGMPQHPSVVFRPSAPLDAFMRSIMAQHLAVVPGRWAEEAGQFAYIKDIPCTL